MPKNGLAAMVFAPRRLRVFLDQRQERSCFLEGGFVRRNAFFQEARFHELKAAVIAGHDFSFALIVDDPDRAVAFPTRPQHIGNGFRAVRYIAHGHMQAFFRGLGLRLRDARGIEFFVASQGGRMLVEQAVPNGAIVFALLLVFWSAQRIGRALIRTPVPALPDMRDPGTNVLARVRVVGFADRPEPRQQRVRCLFRQRSGNAFGL